MSENIETLLQSIQAKLQIQKDYAKVMENTVTDFKIQSIIDDVFYLRTTIQLELINAEYKGYIDAMAKATELIESK